MDVGYTFALGDDSRVMVYAPPGIEVPTTFQVRRLGVVQVAHRLSDRSLECGPAHGVKGACGDQECHRRVLGECQCRRHPSPVPFERVR